MQHQDDPNLELRDGRGSTIRNEKEIYVYPTHISPKKRPVREILDPHAHEILIFFLLYIQADLFENRKPPPTPYMNNPDAAKLRNEIKGGK